MKFNDFFSEGNLLIFNAAALLVLTALHLLLGHGWMIYAIAGFAVFAIEGLVFFYHRLYEENRKMARYLGATALLASLFTIFILGYADPGLMKSMLSGLLSPENSTPAAIASNATTMTTTTESPSIQTTLTTQNTNMSENSTTTSIYTTTLMPSTTIPSTTIPISSISTLTTSIQTTTSVSTSSISTSSISTSTSTKMTTSISTIPPTTSVISGVNTGLGNPTISPSPPAQNVGFTISCPASNTSFDCIDAYANGASNKCTWAQWSGNNAQFSCSGMAAGSYTAQCKASTGTSSNCASATTSISYSIGSATSTTSTTSSTSAPTTIAGTTVSTTTTKTTTTSSTSVPTTSTSTRSSTTSSTSVPTTSTSTTSSTSAPTTIAGTTVSTTTTKTTTTSSTSVPTTSTSTRSSTTSSTSVPTTSTSTRSSTTSSATTSTSTTSSTILSTVTVPSGTLYFSGRYWYIQEANYVTGPGDNYFYYNSNSDYVDGNGYLHMGLFNVQNKRYASAVNTTDSLGYGTYTFLIQGDISHLDKNAVLGLFTWDDNSNTTPGNLYNREIDIEMSRWGAQNGPNAEMGVQPEPPAAVLDYNITYTGDILASMTWKPGEVDFSIRQSPSNIVIKQWNYIGSLVPTPGAEKTYINLWAFFAPTSSNVTVVIKSFSFTKT